MFSGPGTGAACAACGLPVGPDKIGIEIQFTALGDQRSFRDVLDRLGTLPVVPRYHLHVRCFAAWEFERSKVGVDGRAEQHLSI